MSRVATMTAVPPSVDSPAFTSGTTDADQRALAAYLSLPPAFRQSLRVLILGTAHACSTLDGACRNRASTTATRPATRATTARGVRKAGAR